MSQDDPIPLVTHGNITCHWLLLIHSNLWRNLRSIYSSEHGGDYHPKLEKKVNYKPNICKIQIDYHLLRSHLGALYERCGMGDCISKPEQQNFQENKTLLLLIQLPKFFFQFFFSFFFFFFPLFCFNFCFAFVFLFVIVFSFPFSSFDENPWNQSKIWTCLFPISN